MATPLAPPHTWRATPLFLVAVAGALQTLAGALAMPDWIYLSVSGFGGPLLLGLLVLRVRTLAACRLVFFLTELLALLALAAVVFAVTAPSTAGGLLLLLWLSWLLVLPLFIALELGARG